MDHILFIIVVLILATVLAIFSTMMPESGASKTLKFLATLGIFVVLADIGYYCKIPTLLGISIALAVICIIPIFKSGKQAWQEYKKPL